MLDRRSNMVGRAIVLPTLFCRAIALLFSTTPTPPYRNEGLQPPPKSPASPGGGLNCLRAETALRQGSGMALKPVPLSGFAMII